MSNNLLLKSKNETEFTFVSFFVISWLNFLLREQNTLIRRDWWFLY